MEFDKVTAQHIKQGIKDFEEKGYPDGFGPSSTYDVHHEGKLYPPKAIMAYANYHSTGRTIERYFKGGKDTDCFKAFERNGFEIVEKQKKDLFNWAKTHLELATYLRDKRSKTSELIELLKESGVNVMQDQSEPGVSVPLEEMDPFTFICHIYKYGEKKRLDIIQKIAKKLGLFIPDGERGIPSANAQKVWMFPYSYTRKGNEFDILWELFEATISDTITDDLFQRALNIRNVGKTKLTEVLFYVRPFDYFPLNGPSRPYVKEELSISPDFNTYEEYVAINNAIKSKSDIPFPQLSYKSWNYTNNSDISKDEQDLLKISAKFSKNELTDYFAGLDQFLTDFDFSIDDEKLAFNVRPEGLRFIVGQRAVWDLESQSNNAKLQVISDKDFFPITHKYKGNDGAIMVGLNSFHDLKPHWNHVSNQVGKEYETAIKSSYKRFQNYAFAKTVFDKKYREQIFNRIDGSIARESDSNYNKMLTPMTNSPLNQILYGPPGTGKTYYLKEQLFDKYTLKEEAITEEKYFEEIITGLTWWQVIALALSEIGTSKVNDILENRWVATKAELSESKNVRATIWGTLQMHTIQESENVAYKQRQNPLIFDKTNDKTWQLLSDEVKEQSPEIFDVLEDVNNFNSSPQKAIKNYDFVTFHQSFAYEDFIEGIKPISPEEGEETIDLGYKIENGVFKDLCIRAKNDPDNRYAIFIDEINRGNVSAIFGELITLIETDKRKGCKNELNIKLPYSKKEFSVPSNLDIYGTMNTADRSVEALDTALRRRFEFKEMMPNYDVIKNEEVDGIKLSDVLKIINERIELLIDRDHTIGHSYFVNVHTKQKLANAFNNKIVPLLQEYFYGDYGKIGLVLGKGFVEKKENKQIDFADFKYDNSEDFKAPTFILKQVNTDSIIEAVSLLLGKIDTKLAIN